MRERREREEKKEIEEGEEWNGMGVEGKRRCLARQGTDGLGLVQETRKHGREGRKKGRRLELEGSGRGNGRM
jgi:hypothetical protein